MDILVIETTWVSDPVRSNDQYANKGIAVAGGIIGLKTIQADLDSLLSFSRYSQ